MWALVENVGVDALNSIHIGFQSAPDVRMGVRPEAQVVECVMELRRADTVVRCTAGCHLRLVLIGNCKG